MIETGAFEAKAHFGELLVKVSHGASYMITKRGKPVACLVPMSEIEQRRPVDLLAQVKDLQNRIEARYGVESELTLKEMIEEGRH